ncbi:hypothetical protein E4K62_00765 [Microbacterium wangchenii]|uniref:Uncharacterized protein n=1 Tax=Microbacterium wangchenii TaxID=2541726 RepID=A0ABX5SQC4_9MICO|nr:hypothetical protein E4K62_00765 [Microbacterium wangchenii]TXK14680.1 hypothetical protein FVP99_13345 [Microbacterium wangchenii]
MPPRRIRPAPRRSARTRRRSRPPAGASDARDRRRRRGGRPRRSRSSARTHRRRRAGGHPRRGPSRRSTRAAGLRPPLPIGARCRLFPCPYPVLRARRVCGTRD